MVPDSTNYQQLPLISATTHGNFLYPFFEGHGQIHDKAGNSSDSGCFCLYMSLNIEGCSFAKGRVVSGWRFAADI
jgi:hypothetical protein